MLTRMDYVATDFNFGWRFISKIKLLRFRETSKQTNKLSRLGSIINDDEIRKNKICLLNRNTHRVQNNFSAFGLNL